MILCRLQPCLCGSSIERARYFALVNFAMADGAISAWDAKYFYNFWRPIRAIRQIQPDGTKVNDFNNLTKADCKWTPYGSPATNQFGYPSFTPPFPSYTSGHAVIGTSAFTVMQLFFRNDSIPFKWVSDEFNGVNRASNGKVRPKIPAFYPNISSAIMENAMSRIWLGVHFPFDAEAGMAQGAQVGRKVFNSVLGEKMKMKDDKFMDRGKGRFDEALERCLNKKKKDHYGRDYDDDDDYCEDDRFDQVEKCEDDYDYGHGKGHGKDDWKDKDKDKDKGHGKDDEKDCDKDEDKGGKGHGKDKGKKNDRWD